MTSEMILFYFFSSLAIINSIMVTNSRNPIYSVLFLVLVFCNASGLLLLLETDFIAMLLIIIYVGAIAVLFLFVVMMLNVRITELKKGNILKFLSVGTFCLFLISYQTLLLIEWSPEAKLSLWESLDISHSFLNISNSFSSISNEISTIFASQSTNFNQNLEIVIWVNQINYITNVTALGHVLYTYYAYCFIVASLVLLVAMIGAILLTMRKSSNAKHQDIFDQVYGNINMNIRFIN